MVVKDDADIVELMTFVGYERQRDQENGQAILVLLDLSGIVPREAVVESPDQSPHRASLKLLRDTSMVSRIAPPQLSVLGNRWEFSFFALDEGGLGHWTIIGTGGSPEEASKTMLSHYVFRP